MPGGFDNGMDLNLMILMEQVGDIVREVAKTDIPDREANLAQYGMDSMALLDVLAVLEERFGIFVNESVIEEFHSISRITRVVRDVIRTSTSG